MDFRQTEASVQQLSQELQEYASKYAELENTIKETETTRQKLDHERAYSLSVLENKIQILVKDIGPHMQGALKVQLALSETRAQAELHLNKARQSIEQSSVKILKLEEEIKILKIEGEKLRHHDAAVQNLARKKLGEADHALKLSRHQTAQSQSELKGKLAELEQTKNQLSEFSAQLKSAFQKNQVIQTALEKAQVSESELQFLRKNVQEFSQSSKKLEGLLESGKSHVVQQDRVIAYERAEKQRAFDFIERAKKEISALRDQRKQLQNQEKQARNQFSDLQKSFAVTAAANESELARARKSLADVSTQFENAVSRENALKAILENERKQMKNLQATLQDAIQAEVEKGTHAARQNQLMIETLLEEKEQLQRQVEVYESARQTNAPAEVSLKAARGEIQESTQKISLLTQENSAMKSQLMAQRQELKKQMEEALFDKELQQEEVENENIRLAQQVKRLNDDLQEMMERNVQLTERVEQEQQKREATRHLYEFAAAKVAEFTHAQAMIAEEKAESKQHSQLFESAIEAGMSSDSGETFGSAPAVKQPPPFMIRDFLGLSDI